MSYFCPHKSNNSTAAIEATRMSRGMVSSLTSTSRTAKFLPKQFFFWATSLTSCLVLFSEPVTSSLVKDVRSSPTKNLLKDNIVIDGFGPRSNESPGGSHFYEIETSSERLAEEQTTLTSTWDRCSSHQTCEDCDSAWTCHWCSYDNACHVKGSIHGCAVGASCSPSTEQDSQTCADHKTCADCSASAWNCHWCAFDEACHVIGSVHGCSVGVNCYAIDRCQRLTPEKVDDGGLFSKSSFEGVGPVVRGVVWVVVGLVLCCASLCFAGATMVKCAVDDLVGEQPEMVEDGVVLSREERENAAVDEQEELEFALLPQTANGSKEAGATAGADLANMQIDTSTSEVASTNHSRVLASLYRQPKGNSVHRMYCACQICYFVTIAVTAVLATVSFSYAPRQPEYNVCTDQLAWKSIVEGMASLKMSASFDLLISVHNPNRFEVDLSNGAGQFHHDGEYVGSFTIPSGQISAKAISDLVVKCTFTPDKWSALSLTSEYYRGTLKFVVGGHTHVKIPALGNYQFDAKFDEIEVNVNDPSLDDTHLCGCPGWKKPLSH